MRFYFILYLLSALQETAIPSLSSFFYNATVAYNSIFFTVYFDIIEFRGFISSIFSYKTARFRDFIKIIYAFINLCVLDINNILYVIITILIQSLRFFNFFIIILLFNFHTALYIYVDLETRFI